MKLTQILKIHINLYDAFFVNLNFSHFVLFLHPILYTMKEFYKWLGARKEGRNVILSWCKWRLTNNTDTVRNA